MLYACFGSLGMSAALTKDAVHGAASGTERAIPSSRSITTLLPPVCPF